MYDYTAKENFPLCILSNEEEALDFRCTQMLKIDSNKFNFHEKTRDHSYRDNIVSNFVSTIKNKTQGKFLFRCQLCNEIIISETSDYDQFKQTKDFLDHVSNHIIVKDFPMPDQDQLVFNQAFQS